MMRGGHSASEHCVPTVHANDAASVAMSWPVGCELIPPSEQNDVNAHALVVSQATSGGVGSGGGDGLGGGGLGNGCCGAVLKDAAVTEEIVPGPQSVLRWERETCQGKKRRGCVAWARAQHAGVALTNRSKIRTRA